jgi:hypothetical protein
MRRLLRIRHASRAYCGYLERGKFINPPALGGNNSTVGNVNSFGQIAGLAETEIMDEACGPLILAARSRV